MLGVGILPDDLVVVRRQQTANNGEIVVALIGDEATVKTFKKQNGEIWLLPANPTTSPSTDGSARCSARSLPSCASIEPETDPVY